MSDRVLLVIAGAGTPAATLGAAADCKCMENAPAP